MKLYLHDYTGHVAQLEVARALAERGHQVVFTYCDQFSTPRGDLNAADGLDHLTIRPVSIGQSIDKKNYVRRQWQDLLYRKALVNDVSTDKFDAVLSSNTPLVPQGGILRHCKSTKTPIVHWWTEVYSYAVRHGLSRKSKLLGKVVGGTYQEMERRLVESADTIIAIGKGFQRVASDWKVKNDLTLIPVAAPTRAIVPGSKNNEWSQAQGVAETTNIVYSGTLGIKHRPELISNLAASFQNDANVRLIVVSEGPGAEFLKNAKQSQGLDNLILLPFQPFDQYANVLACGDVHVTVLEPEAASYSLPSKVISQLCAGRAQVAVVPDENEAAIVIREAEAGFVAAPGKENDFQAHVKSLLADEGHRNRCGENARRYAEERLDISLLVPRYEEVLSKIVAS